MGMDIVEPSPDNLRIAEAAAIVGCSAKTVRRAVHSGHLPGRYAPGPRGPELLFAQADLARWLVDHPPRTHRGRGRASAAACRTRTGDALVTLQDTIADMQANLAAARRALGRVPAYAQSGADSASVLPMIESVSALLGRINRYIAASRAPGSSPAV